MFKYLLVLFFISNLAWAEIEGTPIAVVLPNTSLSNLRSSTNTAITTWPTFSTASNTFTAIGNGTTLDVSSRPLSSFAIQVNRTGGDATTTWTAVLEGSLDGINFTTILSHSNISPGVNSVLYSGSTLSPSRFFRCRIDSLSLSSAVNIVCLILGVP